MFKVNNKNTRTIQSRRSVVIFNFEHILYHFIVLLLLTLNM